jgi:V-type H+-transporting ATPase proteolipid subunit
MGNILRQLSKGDGTGEPTPASLELEKVLPAYVKEHKIQDQRLAVWALVEPGSSSNGAVTISESIGDPSDHVSVAIRNGARLHRVVSGGGGWGKKQGLLSLDPEYRCHRLISSKHPRPIDEIFEEPNFGIEDSSKPDHSLPTGLLNFVEPMQDSVFAFLPEVINRGDSVQFFVSPLADSPPSTAVSITEQPRSSPGKCIRKVNRYSFGVLAVSDSPPSQPSSPSTRDPTSDEDGAKVIALPNHFGVMSEKYITFAVLQHPRNDPKGRYQETSVEIRRTKIDVPGSQFVVEFPR